jgi:hypothetical protein
MEYACLKMQSAAFAWRFPLAFQGIFLLILLVAIPFYPESPRYLMKIQRLDSARQFYLNAVLILPSLKLIKK